MLAGLCEFVVVKTVLKYVHATPRSRLGISQEAQPEASSLPRPRNPLGGSRAPLAIAASFKLHIERDPDLGHSTPSPWLGPVADHAAGREAGGVH